MIGLVMSRMIQYFGSDKRRIHHAMKVFGFSCALWSKAAEAQSLSSDDPRRESLLIAAILHDIGIPEAERVYGSSEGRYQEIEGPPIAETMLRELGADEDLIRRVSFLIGHHHTYAAIDDLDFRILVEADLFVNLEEEKLPRENIVKARDRFMSTHGAAELLEKYLLSGMKMS